MIQSQHRVAASQLKQDEVSVLAWRQFASRAIVEDQTVVLLRDELNACVTVLALWQGGVPCPAIAMETVTCLLTARPIKLVVAGTAANKQTQWNIVK